MKINSSKIIIKLLLINDFIKAFEIDFKRLCLVTISLPLVSFVTCVLLSIYNDFERATRTHCGVKNVLPSISTAIGDFYPQIIIWRLAIGLHSFPRYVISAIHYKDYFNHQNNLYYISSKNSYKKLIKIAFVFNYIEITCLSLLTFVSSRESHSLHALFFIVFLISSTIYMSCICISYYYKRINQNNTDDCDLINFESNAKKTKLILLIVYLGTFLISLYFYIRHNTYCEPYMFSYFSLCEYFTVFTNIAFHYQVLNDFNLFKKPYKLKVMGLKVTKKFP